MKSFIRILFLLSSILLFSSTIFGQLVSDASCKEFENAVAKPLNPAHWYHNIVFKNECWLEFAIDVKDGVGISFRLEKFKTNKAARKTLHSDIDFFEFHEGIPYLHLEKRKKFKFPKFAKNDFWDEAYFSESYGPMMLRRERTFIKIFCDKTELCLQIEKGLRGIGSKSF